MQSDPREPMVLIKQRLYDFCLAFVERRIAGAQQAIQIAQASSREDTKSSAGDKYETGRAMMQLEVEKNLTQLAEAQKLKQSLTLLANRPARDEIQPGSLALTDQGNYYLAISAGKITLDGTDFIALSPASPLGAIMLNLKEGSIFTFQSRSIRVLTIA